MEGNTEEPLVIAAWLGEESNVRTIMKTKKTPPNVIGAAMFAASDQGHEKVVEAMLILKADPNSELAERSLVQNFVHGHDALGVVPMFIKFGLNPRSKAAGDVFEYAADKGKAYGLKTVDLLLEKGLHPKSQAGGKGLVLAAQAGHVKIVSSILDANADAGSHDGGLAMRCAALLGQFDVIKLLLSAGADASSEEGNEALNCAVHIGNYSISKLLLESDADPSRGLPPAAFRGNAKFVRMLLEAKADASSRKKGLREAARFGHQAVLDLLYEDGVDIKSRAGTSALRMARGIAEAENFKSEHQRKVSEKMDIARSLEKHGAKWALPSMHQKPQELASTFVYSIAPPSPVNAGPNPQVVGPRWYSATGRLAKTHSEGSLIRKQRQLTDCPLCHEYDRCQFPASHPPYKTADEYRRYPQKMPHLPALQDG